MKKWKLNSWNNFPAKHLPNYEDKKELDLVLSKIQKYPPLVFAGETRSLKKALSQVVEGKAFLLQGGDCAESFAEFHPDNIRDTLKVILPFSFLGLILLQSFIKSSGFKVGPHLIPTGFSIPLQNSTCPPSSCLVLSPIQTK